MCTNKIYKCTHLHRPATNSNIFMYIVNKIMFLKWKKKGGRVFFLLFAVGFFFMDLIPLAGSAEVRAIPHKQTKSELSLKLLTKNCMVTIFVLNKFIPTHESYSLVSGRLHVHLTTLTFVMERIMALQQMIDKKNTFLFI